MQSMAFLKIAILDDYQNAALKTANWSPLQGQADITVFNDHLAGPLRLVERLQAFDVLVMMREPTPLTREILHALPRLGLIASTGISNAPIDE